MKFINIFLLMVLANDSRMQATSKIHVEYQSLLVHCSRHLQIMATLRGGSGDQPVKEGIPDLVLAFWERQVPVLMKHVQNVLKTMDKVMSQATIAVKGLQSGMEAQCELATSALERFQNLQQTNQSEEDMNISISTALDATSRLEGALVMNLCSMLLALRKVKAAKESIATINRLTDGGVMEELHEHVASLRARSP